MHTEEIWTQACHAYNQQQENTVGLSKLHAQILPPNVAHAFTYLNQNSKMRWGQKEAMHTEGT